MLVHGLARNKEAHDFARALDNQVDAQIAHGPLDRNAFFSAAAQGIRGFIAAPAPYLHRVVDDAPNRLGTEKLRHGRFQADVGFFLVSEPRGKPRHTLHGKGGGCHGSDFVSDGIVMADGRAPLLAFHSPFARHIQAPFGRAACGRGNGEPPRVQRDQREFQPLAQAPDDIFLGHFHVFETHQAVLNTVKAHEAAAVCGLHARHGFFHDKGRDFFLFLAVHGHGRLRHHHHDVGHRAVRAPEFLAVQNIIISVVHGRGRGLHLGRVRTHLGLGESESRNLALGKTRQVFLFLLFRSEKEKRLGHANALMRRKPHSR